MVATETFIGQPVLRKEDGDLLTGQARFIDNFTMPGMLWMAMVRPPYVHATINSVDTSAAASMPGVVGVYTGKDLSLGALPAAQANTVWAALPMPDGSLLLGTGNEGKLLKVAGGNVSELRNARPSARSSYSGAGVMP